jgi:succinate dehydrogenase / fumarate reductase flavoprotein subunit
VHVRYADAMPWRMALCEQDITESMLRFARKNRVKFVDHVAMVDLIKDGERVAGAVGFSVIDGTFYTVKAKAVILANGCQNYKLMRRWASGRGDGIAAAYRAGAEMRNAEFGSFINWVFADTKEVCQGAENVLYNARGENLSKVVRPVIEADLGSEEVVAWYKTMLAGDGPVYANMPENEIAKFSEKAFHSDGVTVRPITTRFWTLTIGKAMAASKNPGPMQEVFPGFIGEQSPLRVDHPNGDHCTGSLCRGRRGRGRLGLGGRRTCAPGSHAGRRHDGRYVDGHSGWPRRGGVRRRCSRAGGRRCAGGGVEGAHLRAAAECQWGGAAGTDPRGSGRHAAGGQHHP